MLDQFTAAFVAGQKRSDRKPRTLAARPSIARETKPETGTAKTTASEDSFCKIKVCPGPAQDWRSKQKSDSREDRSL